MTNDEKLMQQAHDALLNFENDISDEMFAVLTALRARLAEPPCKTGSQCIGGKCPRCVEPVCDKDPIEAPVQITDEYVRNYLWEHNLVAVDEADFKKLMQPTRMLAMPEVMEQAGWVRKRDWAGLTEKEVEDIVESTNYAATYIYFKAIEAKLQEKE